MTWICSPNVASITALSSSTTACDERLRPAPAYPAEPPTVPADVDVVRAPGSVLVQDIGMGCLRTSEWLPAVGMQRLDAGWCRNDVWSSPLSLPAVPSPRSPVGTAPPRAGSVGSWPATPRRGKRRSSPGPGANAPAPPRHRQPREPGTSDDRPAALGPPRGWRSVLWRTTWHPVTMSPSRGRCGGIFSGRDEALTAGRSRRSGVVCREGVAAGAASDPGD